MLSVAFGTFHRAHLGHCNYAQPYEVATMFRTYSSVFFGTKG